MSDTDKYAVEEPGGMSKRVIRQIIYPSFAFPQSGERIVVDGKKITRIEWEHTMDSLLDVYGANQHGQEVLLFSVPPFSVASVAYVA